MITFSVAGAGNLGANLIYSLRLKEYHLQYVFAKSRFSEYDSYIEKDIARIIIASDVVFLTVRESQIPDMVQRICRSEQDLSHKIFLHMSNTLTSDILMPLKHKGAVTGSFSPLQTFPSFYRDETVFKGVYFLSEGDAEAVKISKSIAADLGAFTLEVEKEAKVFFHIGAVISSNFLNSLIRFSDKMIRKGGDFDFRILLPLIKRTLLNIEKYGLKEGLTGPAERGETGVVAAHMNALEGKDQDLYRLLSAWINGGSGDLP